MQFRKMLFDLERSARKMIHLVPFVAMHCERQHFILRKVFMPPSQALIFLHGNPLGDADLSFWKQIIGWINKIEVFPLFIRRKRQACIV